MKNLVFLLILLYAAMSSCKPNEYEITKKGVDSIIINYKYSDFINLYKAKGYLVKQVDGPEGNIDAGLFIYDRDQLILKVNNKNWNMPPHVVKMINIYSDKFKTKEGIHVGMTIKELLKIYPKLNIEMGGESAAYLYFPPSYQSKKFIIFGSNIVFQLEFSISNKDLSIDQINNNLNNIDGKIDCIIIYDFD